MSSPTLHVVQTKRQARIDRVSRAWKKGQLVGPDALAAPKRRQQEDPSLGHRKLCRVSRVFKAIQKGIRISCKTEEQRALPCVNQILDETVINPRGIPRRICVCGFLRIAKSPLVFFVSAVLRVPVPTETANFTTGAECKETDVLIGADNDSLPRVHENLILRIGEAGHLNKALVHDNFCISDPIHGYAEFSAANRDRGGGTVDSVWIWFPTEMVDFYPNAAQQNFKHFPESAGGLKVFQ